MRTVTTKELLENGYDDVPALSALFARPVVEDGGVWRWRASALVRRLTGGDGPFYAGKDYNALTRTLRGSIDLNALWLDFYRGAFPLADLMRFYMDLGYSLCGFAEVFGQDEAADWNLPGAPTPAGGDEYAQTPIEWALANLKAGEF